MKQCWLHLPEWNKDLVTEAIESGVDVILTVPELCSRIRELGRIKIAAPENGDLLVPDDIETVIIKNKNDEDHAADLLKNRIVAVRTTDWDIIPLENLIPVGGERLFTFVRGFDDAVLAAGVMEKGVAGVILETDDPGCIREVADYIRNFYSEKLNLVEFEIIDVKTIGIGDRVCVDTCSNLGLGEGLLVGNSSQGMFLVHAENLENPYVAPRPFRINAGAVHSYIKVPDNRTRYLGELKTGDPVLLTASDGTTATVYVGRSKIEKRPMLVVSAMDSEGNEFSVVLQNAETIRLTGAGGKALSVVNLSKGDKVLGVVERGGRHFGMSVDETIVEQ